jgi:hypothetical protein
VVLGCGWMIRVMIRLGERAAQIDDHVSGTTHDRGNGFGATGL